MVDAVSQSPGGASSPGSPNDTILSTVAKWSVDAVQLKDLSKKNVPNLLKVIRGQYRNIGIARAVYSDLYIHSIGTTKKILAEGVKVKDNKRLLQTDQRFSMPVTYQGWFELLSEDGKAIKALQNVQELARLFPQSCLVRDSINVYVPRESGDLALDKVRKVHAGELLTLAGEINIPLAPANSKQGQGSKRRLLKCFDNKGDSVYLDFDQKGTFSPVAGQANISGVHNIKSLMEKFRFPILVRLVHGIIPTKVERTFTGVFRLTSVYSDETAFVIPLKKDAKMVPISTREPLKVSVASNFNKLVDLDDTAFFHQKCHQMIGSYMNSIHVLVAMPDPSLLAGGKVGPTPTGPQRKHSKEESANPNHQIAASANDNPEEEDILFQEIEDIYHYVRVGGPVPPPDRPRPQKQKQNHSSKSPQQEADKAMAKAMANPALASARASKRPTAAVAPVAPKASSPLRPSPSKGSIDHLGVEDRKSMGDTYSKDSGENITWEEPIYEPLEKIRGQKKKVQELEQTIVFEGDFKKEEPRSPDPMAVGSKQPSTPISPDTPVSSLREVIKQFQQDTPVDLSAGQRQAKSVISYHTSDDKTKTGSARPVALGGGVLDVPPLPPRKYSDGEHEVPLNLDTTGPKSAKGPTSPTGIKPATPVSPVSPVDSTPHPLKSAQPSHSRHGVVNISIHNSTNAATATKPTLVTAVVPPSQTGVSKAIRPSGEKKRQAPPPPMAVTPHPGPTAMPRPGLVNATSSHNSMLHANHLVYNPTTTAATTRPVQLLPAPQEASRVYQPVGAPRTTPQYVAVARVGDVVHSPATMVTTSPAATPLETRTLNRNLSRTGRLQPTFLT